MPPNASLSIASSWHRQIGDGDAADQKCGELADGISSSHGRIECSVLNAEGVLRNPPVEHEFARFGSSRVWASRSCRSRTSTPRSCIFSEIVVVLLGLVHPDHVVKEQIVAVAWGEPLMRQDGPADHHRPQFADFRVNAELSHSSPP